MIVVLDTNALIQVFGVASPLAAIREALRHGRLRLAVSTPVLLEYEEVTRRYSGSARWEDVWRFLTAIDVLHGTIHHIGPRYASTPSPAIRTTTPLPIAPSRQMRTTSSPPIIISKLRGNIKCCAISMIALKCRRATLL